MVTTQREKEKDTQRRDIEARGVETNMNDRPTGTKKGEMSKKKDFSQWYEDKGGGREESNAVAHTVC